MHSMAEQLSDVVIVTWFLNFVFWFWIWITFFPAQSVFGAHLGVMHQYLASDDIHFKQVMQAPEDVEEDDFRMLFEQMERLEPQSLRKSVWITV